MLRFLERLFFGTILGGWGSPNCSKEVESEEVIIEKPPLDPTLYLAKRLTRDMREVLLKNPGCQNLEIVLSVHKLGEGTKLTLYSRVWSEGDWLLTDLLLEVEFYPVMCVTAFLGKGDVAVVCHEPQQLQFWAKELFEKTIVCHCGDKTTLSLMALSAAVSSLR